MIALVRPCSPIFRGPKLSFWFAVMYRICRSKTLAGFGSMPWYFRSQVTSARQSNKMIVLLPLSNKSFNRGTTFASNKYTGALPG